MSLQVSVVIPAYNESTTIAQIVRIVLQVPEVGEVIVISDGSTDATTEMARASGARVLELAENLGKGGAIAAGNAQAQFEVVLFLDADLIGLTPGHVFELIEPVLAGEADMTVGVFTQGKKASDLAQRVAPFLSGQRALRRSAFSGLRLEKLGYGMEVALTRWATQNSLAVKKVSLAHLTHSHKEVKRRPVKGILARLQMYWEIARTAANINFSNAKPFESPAGYKGINSFPAKIGMAWQVSLLVAVLLLIILSAYDAQAQKAITELRPLQELPAEAVGPRILVVAPHPDDETLGVGGLIQQALNAGSQVRVVFMTNGDGFRRGAQEEYSRPVLKPEDYISYGKLRQQEALKALSTLGLSGHQVTFLGYPDGGLSSMWERYWDPKNPYASRYTKRSKSPYENSYQPEAPYSAVAVLADLESILSIYQPTTIFFPHPSDTHPDHWATNTFLSAAAAQLELTDKTFRPDIYNYIIHRGTWQVLKGVPRTAELTPPADVQGRDTIWYRFSLSSDQETIKEYAIQQYHTQYKIMRRFLLNFVRPNEIFGSLTIREMPITKGEFSLDATPQGWPTLYPVVSDPKGDTFVRQAVPQGDLKALYLAQDQERLYLRVDTWDRFLKPVAYRVFLYVIPANGHQQLERWVLRVQTGSELSFLWEEQPIGMKEPKVLGAIGKNSFEAALPGNLLASAGDKLLLSVESHFDSMVIDKTPWWVVGVPRLNIPGPPQPR